MRVRVNPGERRDERGVTAVIVALLSIVMLGIGAFSIDLGLAYASTRQLQTASDAAALAAANVFKKTTGTSCSTVLNNGATAAAAAAAAIRAENRPGSTQLDYSASCGSDGAITVTYRSQGTTPRFFGQFWGQTGDYTSDKSSSAKVITLTAGNGLRPYALCGAQLTAAPGQVFKMNLPTSGTSICPGATGSGNWWSVDCPESSGNNSNSVLADKTLNGCTTPLAVVPNQSTATSPSGLRTYLTGYCTNISTHPESCLGGNPGKINGNEVLDAWTTLASEQRRITFPVFCGGAPTGPCDQAAVINAGGNNAIYPIQAILGAQVCGWRFGNSEYPAPNTALSGECGGANNLANLSTNDSGQTSQINYLLLRQVDVPASGNGGSNQCELGSACDKGRVAFLTS